VIPPFKPRRLARLTAFVVVLLAVATAAVQIRRGDGLAPAVPPSPVTASDPLADELTRCRTITPGEFMADQACERAWAENGRRFFTPGKSSSQPPPLDMFPGLPTDTTKDHDRAPAPVGPGGVR
jgi:conjugative transfer region protein TrbK